jgi:flavin-dependent dehydrogenase
VPWSNQARSLDRGSRGPAGEAVAPLEARVGMQDVDFLIVGCGPAGGIAAREAARAGVDTLVLEKDAVVGTKRVCAAGLRPGFCENFDLPREIVHCDPPTIALHSLSGRRVEVPIGQGHTTTREELDGTIARLARGEGAEIQTAALFRSYARENGCTTVEYADMASGERRKIRARSVFLAQGSTARIDGGSPLAYDAWTEGLITCYQYRVYLERPATDETYRTLEMHYYVGASGRNIIAWMFPKRDHLAIGLGVLSKLPGKELRAELDAFMPTVERRLFPGIGYSVREEGHILYGGAPRPRISDDGVMIGGTAAGLVDATTGEGIHEAAMSGRIAADAVAALRRGIARNAAQAYERAIKSTFYGRLRQRHKLMQFLERQPMRFDMLFEQLARFPRLASLLQRDRNDFSFGEWLFLYGQAALFAARAVGNRLSTHNVATSSLLVATENRSGSASRHF